MNPTILDRYRPLLRLLVRRIHLDQQLRRRFDTSDLVQEAMLRAVAKAEQFEGETEAQAVVWLKRVLRTVVLNECDEACSGKRNIYREQAIDYAPHAMASSIEGELSLSTLSPVDRMARTELLIKLAERINELPEDQCDVVNLRALQGCTVAEIAQLLGKSEKSVACLLYRGYLSLRNYAQDLGLAPL